MMNEVNKKFINKQRQMTNDSGSMSSYKTANNNDGSSSDRSSKQSSSVTLASDFNQQTPTKLLNDRIKNRVILKEKLRQIRSPENNSITDSYYVVNDTIEITKTQNGAIVLKDENENENDYYDYVIKSKILSNEIDDSKNDDDNEQEFHSVKNEQEEYLSDEDDFKRLEEFYKREGGFYDEPIVDKTSSRVSSANSTKSTKSPIVINQTVNSIIINSEIKSMNSRTTSSAHTLESKSSASQKTKKSENVEDLNIMSENESLTSQSSNSSKENFSLLSKEILNDEVDNQNRNDLNESLNSIKYSTPIPPKSAPSTVGQRRIAVKSILQKFKTLNAIATDNNIDTDQTFGKKIEKFEEKKETLDNFKQASLSNVNTAKVEIVKENEEVLNVSIPTSANEETTEDSTLSDYYLNQLMKSKSEVDETVISIDPDIFEIVCSVMDKMLRRVCRKWYLYSVGIFKPLKDQNDSTLWFFTSQDHLYDNDMFITQNLTNNSIEAFELDMNDDIETSTEISESESNEYFSYLKLNLDNEDIERHDENENKNDKDDALSYISSEEGAVMDEEERRNLNIQLRDEVRLINYWMLNTNVESIKTKLIELKNNNLQIYKNVNSNVLHDDYFFSEYDETKFNLNENREQLTARSISDAGRHANQVNAASRKITDKNLKTKTQIQKENIIKKREERIKLMQKAFATQSIQKNVKKQQSAKEKSLEKYRKPQIKSNIKIIQVPHNFKLPEAPRLPEIKSAKSLPPGVSRIAHSAFKTERAKTAPASGPIDERQKYPRPVSTKQPWGTIVHPPYGLGYQRMTEYEIKQSVSRLYYLPKKKEDPPRSISCLSRTDFYHMVDRLTFGSSDKAADRCRTQEASIYKSMGVLNSYAWKGYYTYPKL